MVWRPRSRRAAPRTDRNSTASRALRRCAKARQAYRPGRAGACASMICEEAAGCSPQQREANAWNASVPSALNRQALIRRDRPSDGTACTCRRVRLRPPATKHSRACSDFRASPFACRPIVRAWCRFRRPRDHPASLPFVAGTFLSRAGEAYRTVAATPAIVNLYEQAHAVLMRLL